MGGVPPVTDGFVVLVDEGGRDIGTAPKLDAHQAPGQLHRAFSVFVFTSTGDVVLQRRAAGKYHFAGRWSNTCCSHPRPGETILAAAARRVAEEMGMACPLREVGTFRYDACDEASGLVERELDHLLVGTSDVAPSPDPAEVGEVRLLTLPALLADLAAHPDVYTPWLPAAAALVAKALAPEPPLSSK